MKVNRTASMVVVADVWNDYDKRRSIIRWLHESISQKHENLGSGFHVTNFRTHKKAHVFDDCGVDEKHVHIDATGNVEITSVEEILK